MGLLQSIGWGSSGYHQGQDLPEIFPFRTLESDFIQNDITNIYSRILKDVLERTHGIPEGKKHLFWDNCLGSEVSDGLVTLISKAMYQKSKLCIIFKKDLNVIRKADQKEESEIIKDYKEKNESPLGVLLTFQNFKVTDMMRIYSCLEYYTISSLHKSMNLSKALQLKISDLRSSVALVDASEMSKQAKELADALNKGRDILIDSKDILELAKPDLTATKASMEFIGQKQSFYLGLPASYITGLAPKGLGDTGHGDSKAVERGLKSYYFSIIKPVVEQLFAVKTTFKSEDFYQIQSALETLKTFDLVGNELLSIENQTSIVNKLFGLPEDQKGQTNETP